MAYVNLPILLAYPDNKHFTTNAPAIQSQNLATIGHSVGMVFKPSVSDTITKVGFRTTAVNAATMDIRLETVDLTTGLPTGTLFGTNTNGSKVLLASDDNAYFEVTLTSPATVTPDDYVAVVVRTTTSTAGTFGYAALSNTGYSTPYSAINTGSWARQNAIPLFSICYGTSGYINHIGILPVKAVNTHTFSNADTPDIYSNKITIPFNCKIKGVWALVDADGDFDINIYSSDGTTVLASASNDAEYPGVTSVTTNYLPLDTEVEFSAGDVFWVAIEPTSATSMSAYSLDFESTDIKKIYIGSSCEYSTAKTPTQPSDWTTTTTRVLACGIMISAIDDGAGIMPNAGLHPIEQGIST